MVDEPEAGAVRPDRRAPTERRSQPRYMFTATAEVAELQSNTLIKGRMSDLSAGGCFVDTTNPLHLGAVVKLRLSKENQSFEARATVVYSQVDIGMGLMFTDYKPGQLMILEKWLGELSGESQAGPVAWEQGVQAPADESLNREHRYVLNQLIITFMRKGLLTEVEGQAMLRKLLR